jgi:hypothetical protein
MADQSELPQIPRRRRRLPWEYLNELNLRRTFGIIVIGLIVLPASAGIVAYYVNKNAINHQEVRNNWYFIISILVSFYSAYFTISAYWIARKVEEYVRTPIRNYADFIEQAKLVLETGRPEFKIMAYYPDFSIEDYVKKKGGSLIDAALDEISKNPSQPIELYILNEQERTTFLKNMEDTVGVKASHIRTVKAHFDELKENFQNNVLKSEMREHEKGRFPIQMFWSSTIMTFVAMHNPATYPNQALKCSGFTSRDPDILAAFRMIFEDFYNNQSTGITPPTIIPPTATGAAQGLQGTN